MAKSNNRNFLYKLFTSVILSYTLQHIEAINCPMNCKCSWVLDSLEANCANSGLIEYPNFEFMPIERVDLSSNYFVEFPTQLSVHDSLMYLDLANNHIEYLDKTALQGFSALRTLILANNTINRWLNLNPSTAFLQAGSLQRLVLSGNTLETFNMANPEHVIVSESLTHLELENCGISKAGGDVLMQNLPHLERLNLNRNPLGALNTLPSKSLRVLELSNCNLQIIPTALLAGLPALEYLQLSWNTALRMDTIERLTSLTLNELDLSYCSLDEIDVSALPGLQQLRLRGNMLRTLTAETFANNTLLEKIDLSRNSLRTLETETFHRLKKLTVLDLAYNEIARLDRNVFRSNDNLASLNLSHNVLDKFTKIISNSLREINLSWCEILMMDSTAFSGLSTLVKLDLSNNLIRDLPAGMRSDTLQKLDLSYCRLSALSNSTFQHFPELAQLKLNGNRFTNPLPREYFRSNKYLDEIWVGDNTWICDCQDPNFIDFYDYLTTKPPRIKDRNSLRCASPTYNYGKTWPAACERDWIQNGHSNNGSKIMSTLFLTIVIFGSLILLITCLRKYLEWRKQHSDAEEYRNNHDEMREIRRLNQRILDEEAQPNAPSSYENLLPTYEDALRMPKPVRPVKSMVDLTEETSRRRRRLRKLRTHAEQHINEEDEEEENDIQYDYRTRFRSEEMLSNRDLERVQQMEPTRRTNRSIAHNNSGSRRFSIEDSRFPAAHLKSQNLQSAEQIGNFQSYENSPYTKRKPKIAEIPPFKRANLKADSVEFLTDPEYDAASKQNSPFAQRKPKTPSPTATDLPAAIDDYFGACRKISDSPEGSDFHIVIEPDIQSLKDIKFDSSSAGSNPDDELLKGKRKKLRNSASRRASGSFIAAAATAAASGETSEEEPIVVVHRPMRETLF